MNAASQPGWTQDPLADLPADSPHGVYRQLRTEAPIYFSKWYGGWVLTRHHDVTTLLRDQSFLVEEPATRLEVLAKRGGPSLDHFKAILHTISFYMNPPRHNQIRRFLSQTFHGLDMSGLRQELVERADGLLAGGRNAGGIDLAGGYGRDLAVFAIHTLLGIPMADCVALAGMAREVAAFFDKVLRSVRELERANIRLGDLLDYFGRLIVERRANPGDDGLSLMIRLAETELKCSDLELAGFCAFFFVAGEETTGFGMSSTSVLLLQDEALRAELVADRSKVPAAAQEFLRLTSPFQYVVRIATEPRTIGGQKIEPGESVVAVLSAANRDPEAFADPDGFRMGRKESENFAFGYGAYRCLGARLATTEMEVCIDRLLEAPDLRLGPDPLQWEGRSRIPSLTVAPASFG